MLTAHSYDYGGDFQHGLDALLFQLVYSVTSKSNRCLVINHNAAGWFLHLVARTWCSGLQEPSA